MSNQTASNAKITPVIETRAVTKTFPGASGTLDDGLTVLQPTSIAIAPGDHLAIVGKSGSGKSTLLSILGTLDEPTTGSVLVEGKDVTTMKEWERSAVRSDAIGFVFQQFHLIPTMTAVENVATGLLYSSISRAEAIELAVTSLESVGLGHRLQHKPKSMSGGEQQRVAIARALVRDPAVLFADEPTGALDSATGELVVQLLAEIAQRGTAIVIVTHDNALASQFIRRIRIHDGVATEETNLL